MYNYINVSLKIIDMKKGLVSQLCVMWNKHWHWLTHS